MKELIGLAGYTAMITTNIVVQMGRVELYLKHVLMVRIADGLGAELDTGKGWEPLQEKLSFRDQTAPRSFGMLVTDTAG